MQLKRLIIQGFKSFKDRTIINFDDGITGIVGPNGCGKSNIVDALFWVMGEQSAKHLRGNSMKDLIFAGSSKYSPGSFAEATLVLENTAGKHIHIGNRVASPSEIQLTRKLYKNGDTEYRINGEPARLKDIQEVFMDTGAGAKSYSIIAQGEINRLVQAKPVERRTMIEEVAGITKFKIRKKESLKKIEATEQNLGRLGDLTLEIDKNLKALQKQAEKAERAKYLKEKIQRNEVSANAHHVFEILKEVRENSAFLVEKKINLQAWLNEKNQLENSLEEERYTREERTEGIENLQKERNEISNKLAKAEERLNSLCNSLTDKENQLEKRSSENEDLKNEMLERNEKIDALKVEREEVITSAKEDFDYESEELRLEELKEELELKQTAVDDLEDELKTKKEAMTKLEQVAFQNNSKLEEYSRLLQDLSTEIEALEKQYSGVSNELAKQRDEVFSSSKIVEELTFKESVVKRELEEISRFDKELEEKFKKLSKEQITTESRYNSLREVQNSLEGAKEGISEFLKSDNSANYKLLGNIIKCDEKYTSAVESLLGEFLETLVTTEDDLVNLKDWIATNSDKALEVLLADKSADLVSEETKERIRLKLGCEITALSEVVQLPEEYKARLTPYLNGLFIASEFSEAKINALASSINFGAVCDISGKFIARNRQKAVLVTIKSQNSQAQSAVARNNKIDELAASLEILNSQVSELELKVIESNNLVREKVLELESVREQLSVAKADSAARKSALDSKLAGMESGNTRLEILQNRKSETSISRLEILEKEESFYKEKSNLEEAIEEMTSLLSDREEEYDTLKSTFDADREVLMAKQVEAKTFEQRVKSLESQITDIENQLERQSLRITNNEELIEKLSLEITNVEEELATLENSNREVADDLSERDEVLSHLKDELSELLISMQEREDRVKNLSKEINKTEKEVTEKEVRFEQRLIEEQEVVKNIFEKYRIDLRQTLGRFLEYSEDDFAVLHDVSTMYFMETENGVVEVAPVAYEFVRKYGQDLKELTEKLKNYRAEFSRLGEINWQAIEDYDRQKLRHDFLKVQEEELRKSLVDLQTAINHIDEKSKERFAVAYEEVNVRFQKVFPIIFGGGTATLKIVGDLDDPECGVDIIAQPPGKKMQNINLMSGGEKAMTAVSLIFSIFLVKPSPFCLLDEVDAPLDDANVGRFNELLREMSKESQFILITHNKKTMELNDTLYGVTMQEPGVSKAVSVQLH